MSTTQEAPAASEVSVAATTHCNVGVLRPGHVEIINRRCYLSPRGEQQAQAAARNIEAKLNGRTVAVLTTDCGRCREAGEIIAAHFGVQASVADCLICDCLSDEAADAIRRQIRQHTDDETLLVIVADHGQVERLTGKPDPAHCQVFFEDWAA